MYLRNNGSNSHHLSGQCAPVDVQRHVIHVSTQNAISSNLLTIDLVQAPLCGVDILKGPTINLERYSITELTSKLNDVLTCHEHLKATGLIPYDKQPIIHFDICYT